MEAAIMGCWFLVGNQGREKKLETAITSLGVI